MSLPKRGEPIPNTLEAWKRHANMMSELVEIQRDTIRKLQKRINQLEQAK